MCAWLNRQRTQVDLVTYIMRTDDLVLRRHLRRRCFGLWSRYLVIGRPECGGRLALVVGALYQAYNHSQFIRTVMPDDLAQLRDGDARCLQRALNRLDHGLRGTVRAHDSGLEVLLNAAEREGQGLQRRDVSPHSARSVVATDVRAARQPGTMAVRMASASADMAMTVTVTIEMAGWGTT